MIIWVQKNLSGAKVFIFNVLKNYAIVSSHQSLTNAAEIVTASPDS